MKFSRKIRNWIIAISFLVIVGFTIFKILSGTQECLPVVAYYEYDQAIPLQDSVAIVVDTIGFKLLAVTYNSINNSRVSGLLSLPKNRPDPVPVIILLHGLGDHKAVDYVEFGNDLFVKNGYAVFRIDVSNHGDRKKEAYDFDLTGPFKYWTRTIISQTVFDLRRAIDFIESQKELDSKRIGYYGISLGGIIGTIFCGVDDRVKVPIVALAGGQLNLLYKKDAFSDAAKEFVSLVEPLNFVSRISPRPFLMLNARNDEIVPPTMSKLLFYKAKEPKEIIWYDAKHRDAPLDSIFGDGLSWFKKNL